jgi:hypothetical protein
MILVKKNTPVVVEVINGQNICLGLVTHETKALDINIEMHTSKVAFNVISSPTNLIIIGLSCSFCTTLKWIGVQRVFILMYLRK